jgi:hypothetical protein
MGGQIIIDGRQTDGGHRSPATVKAGYRNRSRRTPKPIRIRRSQHLNTAWSRVIGASSAVRARFQVDDLCCALPASR